MTESTFSLVNARGRKYLTAAERKRFLAAVRTHPKPAVQTLAQTLVLTGCRVSEALGILACDVDLEAGELRIATLKRRRTHWRAVPVPEDLIRPRTRPPPETRAGAPGVPAGPAPQLRGVVAVTAGVPLPTIAAVLGHASLSTTAIYTTAIGAEVRELVSRVWT